MLSGCDTHIRNQSNFLEGFVNMRNAQKYSKNLNSSSKARNFKTKWVAGQASRKTHLATLTPLQTRDAKGPQVLKLDPSSSPRHTFACTTPLRVRGSSLICSQSQSHRLCAVLSPRCVQHILPPQSLPSLGPVGSYPVVHSQVGRTLVMIFSTIHRDAGCKSYTCCSVTYMSDP